MIFPTSMTLKSIFLHEWRCEQHCENVTPSLVKIADKILFPAHYWFANKKTVFIKHQDAFYPDHQLVIQNKTSGCTRAIINITTALFFIPSIMVGSILKIIAIAKENFDFSRQPYFENRLDSSVYENALRMLNLNEEKAKNLDSLKKQKSHIVKDWRQKQSNLTKPLAILLEHIVVDMLRAYLTIVKRLHPNEFDIAKATISECADSGSEKPKVIEAEEVD